MPWGVGAAVGLALLLWLRPGDPPVPAPVGAAPEVTSAGPTAVASGPAASAPAPPPPAPAEWSQIPLAARLSDLGPGLSRGVYDGLQRARAALEPCFEEDARDAAAHPRAPVQEDAWGAAIVTLQMEAHEGELVIVGAPLQSLGTSSMLLAGCAERTLRGIRFPAPGVEPGRRYRLQYQLVQ
jgi:hypothetical protein